MIAAPTRDALAERNVRRPVGTGANDGRGNLDRIVSAVMAGDTPPGRSPASSTPTTSLRPRALSGGTRRGWRVLSPERGNEAA